MNKIFMLKPSWERDNVGGYVGGAMVIYCKNEEEFKKFFKEELHSDYMKENHPEVVVEKYKPKWDCETAFYLKDAHEEPPGGFEDNVSDYWFLIEVLDAFLPETEDGVILHEYHDG